MKLISNKIMVFVLVFFFLFILVVYPYNKSNSKNENNYSAGTAFIIYSPRTGQWWIQDKDKETTSIVTSDFKVFQVGYSKSADEVGRLWEKCTIDKDISEKKDILCFKDCREYLAKNKPLAKKKSKFCTPVVTTDPFDTYK